MDMSESEPPVKMRRKNNPSDEVNPNPLEDPPRRIEKQLSYLRLEASISMSNQSGVSTKDQIDANININIQNHDDKDNEDDNEDHDNDDNDGSLLSDGDDTDDNNGGNNSAKESDLDTHESDDDCADDNSNKDGKKAQEQNNLLKKIKNSPIFDEKYYTVNCEESTEKNLIATCNFCKPEKIIRGSLRTTSNFTSHLKRKHSENYKEYLEYKKKFAQLRKKISIDRRRWSCTFNQETFEQNIFNFVLKFLLPFSTVEDPCFQKNFNDFQIKKNGFSVKHMTRYSLKNRVDEMHRVTMSEICDVIEQLIGDGGYVCTTADMWSGGSRRFLGVTAHWIDRETLERKSAALACRRFPGTHSFDAIAMLLSNIHTSFGLTPGTIRATVTDNGSNFVKAFKILGIQDINILEIQDSDSLTEDQMVAEDCYDSDDEVADTDEEFTNVCEKILPVHYRCASHTLNLIASTDILKVINDDTQLKRKHESVLKKCTSLWALLRSPKKKRSLKIKTRYFCPTARHHSVEFYF